jgi:hypothetical protein
MATPIRAFIASLANPAVIQQIETRVQGGGALLVLRDVVKLAQVMPGLANMERLAFCKRRRFRGSRQRHVDSPRPGSHRQLPDERLLELALIR